MNHLYLFPMLFCFLSLFSYPQENVSEIILIKGTISDAASFMELPYSMVVNKNSSIGIFADMEGKFSTTALKTDTILISSRGYNTRKICFNDSVSKAVYEIEIMMQKLSVTLKEIEIFPQRKIEEIESDISKMKEFRKTDFMLSGLNAAQSPVTYFYQVFSRRENSKRKVAELQIEDAKREIIKELLLIYVNENIIRLDEREFDDFIDYCDVGTEFLKNCTQYEFIIFLKRKHLDFMSFRDKNNK